MTQSSKSPSVCSSTLSIAQGNRSGGRAIGRRTVNKGAMIELLAGGPCRRNRCFSKKKGGRRPPFSLLLRASLDVEHSHDAQRAGLHHDDLIRVDEIHVAAPGRLDLDDGGWQRRNSDGARHDGADADVEVDVGHLRAAREYGVTDRGLLLGR